MSVVDNLKPLPIQADILNMALIICASCKDPFEADQQIINANGEAFHTRCFVCAQCFQSFQDGIYYEFENRKYCEYDFQLLWAPCCRECKNFIKGRVIKAINYNYHPECFKCNSCHIILTDSSFIKNSQRPFCRDCNLKEKLKNTGIITCHKCLIPIENDLLRHKGEAYHSYHFSCKKCGDELNGTARETKGDLYCLSCHETMDIPICSACHTPIDQERIVYALGKQWHVEHFACAQCEIPFNGSRHFEKRGLAYCETHYNQLFGEKCFECNHIISGDDFSSMNKSWCVEHFTCWLCDQSMNQKTKFYDLDAKPVCKHCFDKLPSKVRSNILKSKDDSKDIIKELNKFSLRNWLDK